MKTVRYRDLSITNLPHGYIVTACDSSGSIGEKEHDSLFCPAEFVGRCAVRVPLMEIFSFGATPICVTNTVSGEMNPTAEKLIAGIKQELELADVGIDVLNGSTEENMSTSMTALGVTAIGYIDELPRMNSISDGDRLVILGKMKVGGEVFEGDESEMATYEDIKYLKSLPYVKEVVPLGSKGVHHEAGLLAQYNNLSFVADDDCDVDLNRSAGPATAVVAVVKKEYACRLTENPKISTVGQFISVKPE